MTQSPYEQPRPTSSPFWRGVGSFFKVLLRLLVALIFGVLIGAGAYYGVPWLYRAVVRPVQENRARIVALEYRLDQEQERVQDEAAALRERATSLETTVTELRDLSGVQAQQLDEMDARMLTLQTQLDVLTAGMTAQETAMASLETENAASLATLEEELGADLQADFDAALLDVEDRYVEMQTQTNTLDGRLALIQTAQDLLKVRLLLLEDNPRAARDTLALAVDHLTRARALTPTKSTTLVDLETRMTDLDALIAESSYRVAPELEALWADVMDLVLPPASELPSPVPTPTPWETPTPTPTPAS